MNVIENILTTKPYKKIRAIEEIRKMLKELQNTEIDFSDVNFVYTYKNMIEKELSRIIKDIPYELNFGDIKFEPLTINENTMRQGRISLPDTRWDRVLNIEPYTTYPRTRTDRRSSGWNFGVDYVNGPSHTHMTLTNATQLEEVFGEPARTPSTISVDDLNRDIVATFNGTEIGSLATAEYTSSRSNAEQN